MSSAKGRSGRRQVSTTPLLLRRVGVAALREVGLGLAASELAVRGWWKLPGYEAHACNQLALALLGPGYGACHPVQLEDSRELLVLADPEFFHDDRIGEGAHVR